MGGKIMKKTLALVLTLVLAMSLTFALVACEKPGDDLEGTAKVVAEASKMSLAELEAAAKAEMEASTDTFKVVGLTSVLKKAGDAFKAKYEWIGDKMDVNNSYKDYALLQALETAEKTYFADYALVQDVRSIAAFDGEIEFPNADGFTDLSSMPQ